jgi:hypothetical protein
MDKKLMTTEELKKAIAELNQKSDSLNEMNHVINSIEIDFQPFKSVLNIHNAMIRVN